jgi:hypothetical protein
MRFGSGGPSVPRARITTRGESGDEGGAGAAMTRISPGTLLLFKRPE